MLSLPGLGTGLFLSLPFLSCSLRGSVNGGPNVQTEITDSDSHALSLSLSIALSLSLSLPRFLSSSLSLRFGAAATKEELQGLALRIDSAVQDLMLVELMAQSRSKAQAEASVQEEMQAMHGFQEKVSWEVGDMARTLADLLKSAAGANSQKLNEIQRQIATTWKMNFDVVLSLPPHP